MPRLVKPTAYNRTIMIIKSYRVISCFVFGCLLSAAIQAQRIYVSGITVNKQEETAVSGEFLFSEEIIKTVLRERLSGLDAKDEKRNGFIVYKGIRITELSPDKLDLYIRIDQAEGKEHDNTVVRLLVSRGYDNFIREGTDQQIIDNLKTFLQSLQPAAEALSLKRNIEAQEELLKKAERRRNDLIDDLAELRKKIAKLQNELDEKTVSLNQQQTVVDKEALRLQELRSRTGTRQ